MGSAATAMLYVTLGAGTWGTIYGFNYNGMIMQEIGPLREMPMTYGYVEKPLSTWEQVCRGFQMVGGIIETADGAIITGVGYLCLAIPGAEEIAPGAWMLGGFLSTNGIQNIDAGMYALTNGEHGQSPSATSGLDLAWGTYTALIPFFPSWGRWGLNWNGWNK